MMRMLFVTVFAPITTMQPRVTIAAMTGLRMDDYDFKFSSSLNQLSHVKFKFRLLYQTFHTNQVHQRVGLGALDRYYPCDLHLYLCYHLVLHEQSY
jgi:hypothetical protein